jgi:signal transduction histidine kinase
MIQEVINNIIRHAGADTIHLVAKKENERLVIKISDNGKGFDAERRSQGVGLQNLKNRSKMINAELSIQSAQHQGTTVVISINKDANE